MNRICTFGWAALVSLFCFGSIANAAAKSEDDFARFALQVNGGISRGEFERRFATYAAAYKDQAATEIYLRSYLSLDEEGLSAYVSPENTGSPLVRILWKAEGGVDREEEQQSEPYTIFLNPGVEWGVKPVGKGSFDYSKATLAIAESLQVALSENLRVKAVRVTADRIIPPMDGSVLFLSIHFNTDTVSVGHTQFIPGGWMKGEFGNPEQLPTRMYAFLWQLFSETLSSSSRLARHINNEILRICEGPSLLETAKEFEGHARLIEPGICSRNLAVTKSCVSAVVYGFSPNTGNPETQSLFTTLDPATNQPQIVGVMVEVYKRAIEAFLAE